jgi:hypothetical protein
MTGFAGHAGQLGASAVMIKLPMTMFAFAVIKIQLLKNKILKKQNSSTPIQLLS